MAVAIAGQLDRGMPKEPRHLEQRELLKHPARREVAQVVQAELWLTVSVDNTGLDLRRPKPAPQDTVIVLDGAGLRREYVIGRARELRGEFVLGERLADIGCHRDRAHPAL